MLRLAGLTVFLLLAILLPPVGAALCAVLLLLQLVMMLLRPLTLRLPPAAGEPRAASPAPVFSVHVATHSEPPELVIRTIAALQRQDWPAGRYEIIVMDNNTADPALWRPVQAYCARQGAGVRFLHRSGVQGAKAGALNIALAESRPDASHIVTVDADYIVTPGFLTLAAEALRKTGADYVQFPQAYRHAAGAAAGVDAELEEYFRSNATVADGAEAVLLTGTLCVISRQALLAAGGWSSATTTEDADMGVRLCNAGFSGRFIHQVVGQGLLPFSLGDLEKQRYRWCSGNFQTLLQHLGVIVTRRSALGLHKRLVIVSQLTAWFNLSLIPTALLCANLLLGRSDALVTRLAAWIILLSLLDVLIRIIGRALRDGHAPGTLVAALASRLALAPQSARATVDAIVGRKLSFVVTDKMGAAALSGRHLPWPHLVLALLSALLLGTAQPDHPVIVAALAALLLPLPAALLTEASLRRYRHSVLVTQAESVA